MKIKYCVEYTIEKENTKGWKFLSGASTIDKKSNYKWFDTKNDARRLIRFLLPRTDVTNLSLTKKIVYKD